MRLLRRLSTTAALLSMCFCSVSNAASSLSTYWLVSCRNWPQAQQHTDKYTSIHTQCRMNIHVTSNHKEGKRGRKSKGEGDRREDGVIVLECGQRMETKAVKACSWTRFYVSYTNKHDSILLIAAIMSQTLLLIWFEGVNQLKTKEMLEESEMRRS